MRSVLAFDLGGTRLKAGVVDVGSGRVLAHDVVEVGGLAVDGVLRVVRATGEGLLAAGDVDVTGVGLCVPGIVADGRVVVLPGKFPGIEGRDLAGWLRTTFDVADVVVRNDAIAYGVGVVAGLADSRGRVVVVTLGTGVGCCVVEDGRPALEGPYGGGLLGGHLPIADATGPLDTAGNAGTFEARCRADRILEEAQEAGCGAEDVPSVLVAAAGGDAAALRGLAAYRRWLVRGLVAVTHAYTPRLLVLGGGPVSSPATAPLLLDGVEAAVASAVWDGCAPEVVIAAAGDHAALLGVAAGDG